ncbi:MAG: redoxin family protein, partial [Hyphomicrobiaceae bacterium]
ALKEKGLQEIFCTAVNDVFVMDAWAKATGAEGKVTMLADDAADFARKCGLEQDLSGPGLGVRSKRYAMIVDNGVVKVLNVEDKPAIEKSTAENLLTCSF